MNFKWYSILKKFSLCITFHSCVCEGEGRRKKKNFISLPFFFFLFSSSSLLMIISSQVSRSSPEVLWAPFRKHASRYSESLLHYTIPSSQFQKSARLRLADRPLIWNNLMLARSFLYTRNRNWATAVTLIFSQHILCAVSQINIILVTEWDCIVASTSLFHSSLVIECFLLLSSLKKAGRF